MLRGFAVAAALGQLNPVEAQHAHEAVAKEKAAGPYKPKVFTAHEWKTVDVLAEIIIPGARNGNAAEFIDTVISGNPQLQAYWTGGIAWLDAQTSKKGGKTFLETAEAARTELLDKIAYRKNASPALAPGVHFFDLARRMTVDAYYTSAAGYKEIGYIGNKGMSEFKVPEASIRHAFERSPFGKA